MDKKTRDYKIKDPITNAIEVAPEKIEIVFRKYYKELYSQPESATRETIKKILSTLKLPTTRRGTKRNYDSNYNRKRARGGYHKIKK